MYTKIKSIGLGSFGIVYKAENVDKDEDYVAIKQYTNTSDEDIPYQILRELNVIKMLKHPNIINSRYIQTIGTSIELIMDYGGENLRTYYKKIPYIQRIKEIKSITYQLLSGCAHMHKLGIIHRDFKPDNILINYDQSGGIVLKICDFSLSKKIQPFNTFGFNSYQICTLWYRPPELFIIDNQTYTTSIDVWSIGCLLYEFITKEPIFSGSTEMTVLKNILARVPVKQDDLDILGLNHFKLESCNNEKFYKLSPLYNLYIEKMEHIRELDEFKKLIESMLILDPAKRITIESALQHPYFGGYQDCVVDTVNYQNFYIRTNLPKQISESLRLSCIKNIMQWSNSDDISEQSVLIAINIFDRFICLSCVLDNLDLISYCCILLASKYIDLRPVTIEHLEIRYQRHQIIHWERLIIQMVDYDLNQPTLLDFYKELNPLVLTIPVNHWCVIKKIIYDYNILVGKGVLEIKEILFNRIKNS